MEIQLELIDVSDVLTIEEQNTIEQEIDRIINAHKNNRQEINRLVFECTAALTEASDASAQLSNKGFFRRLIGGITGSNKKLQDKINRNMREAQYASQVTIQKLAEQNLMSFELLTAVNNKLNASIQATNEMFKQQYIMMGKFFLKNRKDIVNLSLRLDAVEKNVKLLNWQNSIEYLEYNGVEYSALNDVEKIVCLTRDFYDLTGGKWSTSDLLLLKAAMGLVGIDPHTKVNYFETVKTIADTPRLQEKFLGEQILKPIEDPSYLISLGTIEKFNALQEREKYLVDSVVDVLKNNTSHITSAEVKNNLVKRYMCETASVDLEVDLEAYDLMLEFLFNLNASEEMGLLQPADEKILKLFLNNNSKDTFETVLRIAERGNAKALYIIGNYYQSGYEVVLINEKLASEYYEKSYKAGYAVAGIDVAYDLPQDSTERSSILNKVQEKIEVLANKGDVIAQYMMGCIYDFGVGVPIDEMVAANWYKKASEQGLPSAQRALGLMYLNGSGVEQSDKKAFECLQKVAEKGHAFAQNDLAWMYAKGRGVEQSYEISLDWYRKSALQGHSASQYEMGGCYFNGEGVAKSDKMTVEWYKKAAENGHKDAQRELAYMYEQGIGAEQSYEMAVEWYTKAALQGDSIAQNNLACCYCNGQGVEVSDKKALDWFYKAAEQGNAASQYSLGRMYENGWGTNVDYAEAKKWYAKSAEQGNMDAVEKLKNMKG